MNVLLVVNQPSDWPLHIPNVNVVTAQAYLTDPRYTDMANTRVFNLCRSYRYQSAGYYVSLLAAARGHKPVPSVTNIQDMKSQAMVRVVSDDLDEKIAHSLKGLSARSFVLNVYFGHAHAARHERLAAALFNLFQPPFFSARFRWDEEDGWELRSVRPLAFSEIPADHRAELAVVAAEYFSNRRFHVPRRAQPRYSMAILYDEKETDAPSDPEAIERFEKAAAKLGIETEIIGRDDYDRLAEFDALFIRQTTSVMHHTYRFARRAEAEGLVVMDDSQSILRCTNKVYLAELMECHEISAPRTMIVHRENADRIIPTLGLPCVLKQPDSAFSQGVVKVERAEDLPAQVNRLLENSDLMIAQEFIATPFDWRIGILDRKPLYACKYYMARRHWQIVRREGGGEESFGRIEALPVELAPRQVVRAALRVANLIGDGLYGVDLKQVGRRCFVIEVNDNPSLDAGYEDQVLKGDLYLRIMEVFLRRMERRRLAWSAS